MAKTCINLVRVFGFHALAIHSGSRILKHGNDVAKKAHDRATQ